MVCGLLPVVGAPLPLVSYGGTSLLTVLIVVGIVLSINIHDKKV
jgi:rod shape determining protein RodA